MDKDLLKAYEYGNYAKTIKNQINLLKNKMKNRLRYAENGGVFEITPTFVSYVKAHIDQGSTYRAIFLDMYDNPIQIDDVEEFYNNVLEQEKLVLNEYYEAYSEIQKQNRNLLDMLDD